MSSRPALEGHVQADDVTRLKREIAGLEKELEEAKREAERYKRLSADAAKAIAVMQKVFGPDYAALKMVFGEMSRVEADVLVGQTVGEEKDGTVKVNSSIWQERISKLGPAQAKVLQVLLDGGGDMSLQQIRHAAKTHGNTTTYLKALIARNWVQKTGYGTYALKN
jgi:hypothetical protein